MRSLWVGQDLDGIGYDFVDSVRRELVLAGTHTADQLPDAECWNFPKDQWGLTWPQFGEICDAGVDAGRIFREGEPFPHFVDALREIQSLGHKIVLITDRSFGSLSHANTSAWLAEYNVPYDALVFAKDKTIVHPDIMVDDRDINVEAYERLGIPTFVYDRPWNQHVVTPNRVYTMGQYVNEIQKLANELTLDELEQLNIDYETDFDVESGTIR